MKERLEKRLNELRSDFESGQRSLAELENRQANLRNILLRISGAIQVLEEELAREGHSAASDVVSIEGKDELEANPSTAIS